MKDFSEESENRGKNIYLKSPIVPCISDRIYQCLTQDQGTWWSTYTWRADAQVKQPTLSRKLQVGWESLEKIVKQGAKKKWLFHKYKIYLSLVLNQNIMVVENKFGLTSEKQSIYKFTTHRNTMSVQRASNIILIGSFLRQKGRRLSTFFWNTYRVIFMQVDGELFRNII